MAFYANYRVAVSAFAGWLVHLNAAAAELGDPPIESVIAIATATTLVAGFMSARLHAQVDRADARIQQFEMALRDLDGVDGQLISANATAARQQLVLSPILIWSTLAIVALLLLSLIQVAVVIIFDATYSFLPDGTPYRFDPDTTGLIAVFVATLIVVALSALDSGSLLHRLDMLAQRNAPLQFALMFASESDGKRDGDGGERNAYPQDPLGQLVIRGLRGAYRSVAGKDAGVGNDGAWDSVPSTWAEINRASIRASAVLPSWRLPQLMRFCAAAMMFREATAPNRALRSQLEHAAHALTYDAPTSNVGRGLLTVLSGFAEVAAEPLVVPDRHPCESEIDAADLAIDAAAPGQPNRDAPVGDLDVAALTLLARVASNLEHCPRESARACGELYRVWGIREPWLLPLWMCALEREGFLWREGSAMYSGDWVVTWLAKLGDFGSALDLALPDGVPDDAVPLSASNTWSCSWSPAGLTWKIGDRPWTIGEALSEALVAYAVVVLDRNRNPPHGLPTEMEIESGLSAFFTQPDLAFAVAGNASRCRTVARARNGQFEVDEGLASTLRAHLDRCIRELDAKMSAEKDRQATAQSDLSATSN